MKTNKIKKSWGTVWYFNTKSDPFHFALYMYNDDPDDVYLCNVFVKPEYRGEKLGNKILELTEKFAEEHDCKEIRLKVDDDNDFAHKWYKRHGFKDMFHDKTETTRMWMKKELQIMKKINENTKITLTVGQLKTIINEGVEKVDSRTMEKLEKIAMKADYTLDRRGGLDSRMNDEEDFPEVSIIALRTMLQDAYLLGKADAIKWYYK